MLQTLDYTISIGSTPTFLYFFFNLYLYSAYAEHYVYIIIYYMHEHDKVQRTFNKNTKYILYSVFSGFTTA